MIFHNMFATHLHEGVFSGEPEKVPSRNGYGEGLLEAGKRDERVVALCCDLTESTRTNDFAEAFPKRFVQVGIAEQNLVSVASGMAAMGKIPYASSYAMFSPGRSWEQIRTTVAYNKSNVKIIGAHAGVSVGPDGATHQAIEDMAIMRAIPTMVVIAAADHHEARKATLAAAQYDGPVYMRFGRSATPVVTTPESPFTIGKAELLAHASDDKDKKVALISTGTLLYNTLMAAKELDQKGIGVSVLHMATVKPLDEEAVRKLAENHHGIVTIEEHQIIGGLGSAVAEYLAENKPTKMVRVGVKDEFGQSGEPDELIAHYGMDSKAIVAAAEKVLG